MTERDSVDPLDTLERTLGHRFRDPALLEAARTHRSHSHERAGAEAADYERMEFLGDALVGLLVSEWLFHDDPAAAEGTLTRRRQVVVRTSTLAEVARRLGLGQALHLGRGEERTGGREKTSLLADAFEATLGAIFLDGGMRAARGFVRRELGPALRATRGLAETADDFKTRLQERVQGIWQRTPVYRMVSTEGPAHALTFTAEVLVNGRVLGAGSGPSRKEAEQHAARHGLATLDNDENDETARRQPD